MKELSIEEKAKRYDEAIKRANELNYVSDKDSLQRKTVEHIFPELKESEEEKVRKEIVSYLKTRKGYTEAIKDPWIAWLEKQGEQKPAHEIEPTPIFRIGDILKRKGKDYTFRVDRIQGGYYHCDRNNGAFFPIEEQGNWGLIEQEPAWSEEDSDMLDDIVKSLKKYQLQMPNYRVELQMRWLKSLKDRIQPQPKQKWSEEDEAIYYGVIETEQYMLDVVNGIKKFNVGNISIKEECTRELNWLKSLKGRVQPQPKQEWSEEDEKMYARIVRSYTSYEGRILNATNLSEDNRNNILEDLNEQELWLKYRLKSRPQKQCCNDVPSREYILNVWELGNYWKELTNGVCNTEHGTQLEYIQKHWKEGDYYDKISVCPQKHWKPSDEQIRILELAIDYWKPNDVSVTTPLYNLLEQLKKLREK